MTASSAPSGVGSPSTSLGTDGVRVAGRLERWRSEAVGERIWRSDATVWPAATPRDVAERLGWLHLPTSMMDALPELTRFTEAVRADGVRHAVVLGMGGSSLAPDAFHRIFGVRPGYPELLVLDSTHPDMIRALQQRIDPLRSLFLVSSKSGTTTEPLSFHRYFASVLRSLGAAPSRQFVAVTDPGTPLERLGLDEGFRAVFRADPNVGGRYSALTMFGLVPAAVTGVDVTAVLDRARAMATACAGPVPAAANPGLSLGATLGELGASGRDKLTVYTPARFEAFGDWVEQLVAESTGKIGRGILPVVNEPNRPAGSYGRDRLFVELQVGDVRDTELSDHVDRLAAAGHPVVRWTVPQLVDIGSEFFRWEFAVAISGAVLGIDPFDQPDVELAKELARRAMGGSAGGEPMSEPVTVPGDDADALGAAVRDWLGAAPVGGYVAVQAYLANAPGTDQDLHAIRRTLLERTGRASTLGYGPRFLHSTGQFHKGGPNTGAFLQLVDRASNDLDVPGAGFTFGQLIRAQAVGDWHALRQKGRLVLRVDLGTDVEGGLRRLRAALDA